MKIKHGLIGLISILALQATSAFAAPAVVVGNGSGPLGSGTPVQISVNWEGDGTVVGAQFQITYDDASLTPDLTNGCSSANWGCSVQSPGVLQYVSTIVVSGLPTEAIGVINFDISGAAAGTYPLAVVNQIFGDINEGDVPPSGTTDGQITVEGPAYTSSPTPAQGVTLGPVVQNAANPSANVVITNTGAAGTTLTVSSCSITNNPTVFSVDSTAQFTVQQGAPGATRVVTCDATQPIQVHNGEMTCNHDGGAPGETSPAVYALSCEITAGPQPVYNSVPAPGAINMTTTEEGDPVTPVDVVIDNNSGQAGSFLVGSCSLNGGADPQISLTGSGFNIPFGGTPSVQTISCDSSAQGTYFATMTCPNNDTNNPNPTYDITCVIPPPGAAVFRSDPVPGVIDMTAGLDVSAGGTVPDSVLTFFNDAAEQDDNDVLISCVADNAGSPEITVSADLNTAIPPSGSSAVTFMCDATNAGSYSKNYNCLYSIDGTALPAGISGGVQSADYTVTCDVREPESVVEPSPPSGTTLARAVEPGGSAQFSVLFSETADEGVDGSVDCSVDNMTDFVIDTSMPAVVPAGGSVEVVVTGTMPADTDNLETVLNCTYTDSNNQDPGVDVSYPLVLNVGSEATFLVSKTFTDGYDGDIRVMITCNTGLPLTNEFMISPGSPVNFIVASFTSGALDCSITEDEAAGYLATYSASGDSQSVDDDPDQPGCHFTAVAGGDSNACAISNAPEPVDVVIDKVWVIDGAVGNEVVPDATLTLYCDSEIIGGSQDYGMISRSAGENGLSVYDPWYLEFSGTGDQTYTAQVIPMQPVTHCWVTEEPLASGIETENGCTDIEVSVGNPAACTVTNSIFFEGIPTLSQWGMVIMALLMLGVGMVGFRRYS